MWQEPRTDATADAPEASLPAYDGRQYLVCIQLYVILYMYTSSIISNLYEGEEMSGFSQSPKRFGREQL